MSLKTGIQKVKPKPNEAFMRLLRRYRLAKGMSLEVMAGRLKVNANTVQAWEVGRNLPTASMFPKIARVLDLDPLELTRIVSPEPTNPGQLAG